MRLLPLLLLLFCAPASAGLSSTTEDQPYPAAWPPLAAVSPDCGEVFGRYADQNELRYGQVDPATGTRRDGRRESAWLAFHLPPEAVVPDDPRPERQFTVGPGAGGVLTLRYFLDGGQVVRRDFPATAWSCGPEGLEVDTFAYAGAVADKLPAQGTDTRRATLRRQDGHLVIRHLMRVDSRLLGFIPQRRETLRWYRFAALPAAEG